MHNADQGFDGMLHRGPVQFYIMPYPKPSYPFFRKGIGVWHIIKLDWPPVVCYMYTARVCFNLLTFRSPCLDERLIYLGSVRGFPNGAICNFTSTIGNFTNGTIGSQWYHWLTNGFTNGTIGRTLNDIGIPLVPLVEP